MTMEALISAGFCWAAGGVKHGLLKLFIVVCVYFCSENGHPKYLFFAMDSCPFISMNCLLNMAIVHDYVTLSDGSLCFLFTLSTSKMYTSYCLE